MAAAVGATLLLSACGSTASMESTYTAPNANQVSFKKILVLAMTADGGLRRTAEDTLAAQVGPAEAVRSYQVFQNEEQLKNRDVVAARMRELGVDGILTLRPLYNQQEVTSYGSSYPYAYRSFGGYYGYGWGAAPYDMSVDKVIGLETNIYSAAKGDLIWSGVTKSYNPGDMQTLVGDVAKTVRAQLEKQGLVKPRPKT